MKFAINSSDAICWLGLLVENIVSEVRFIKSIESKRGAVWAYLLY